jgi:hypothetical protein
LVGSVAKTEDLPPAHPDRDMTSSKEVCKVKVHRLDHIHIYCLDPDANRLFFVDVLEAEELGKAP